MDTDDLRLMSLGLGEHIGRCVLQRANGELVADVVNTGNCRIACSVLIAAAVSDKRTQTGCDLALIAPWPFAHSVAVQR